MEKEKKLRKYKKSSNKVQKNNKYKNKELEIIEKKNFRKKELLANLIKFLLQSS